MEQLNQFPIVQVVGYKNSGKSTLVQKLLNKLVKENQQFGVLKHHGHGGLPVIHDKGTDTWKYRESGASVTAVEGAGYFQFSSNLFQNMTINSMISFFQLLPLNGLIIEGFKNADYPKIVLIRSEEDLVLLDKVSNSIGIIYWNEELMQNSKGQPQQFAMEDEDTYIPYIVDWLKGAVK